MALDEEGYFVLSDGIRLSDPVEGKKLLESLSIDDFGAVRTQWNHDSVIVEPFDKPLIAQQVEVRNSQLYLVAPYGFSAKIQIESFCLDAWDRFHGLTEAKNIPFVFSRKAQAEFFRLLDEYDDDSFTLFGKKYSTPDYYIDNTNVNQSTYWSQRYTANETGWDLGEPHPALQNVLPQLKLNKCRVLALGCGRGHDAAYFSQLGHIVTGIDFSANAIEDAQKKYGTNPLLRWQQADALALQNFPPVDLIFEHTLFCAIDPKKRKNLVQQWKRLLDDQGHLLGVFFVQPKRNGPPYGGSEWELRELLEKDFRLLYWKRWPLSPGVRNGTEIVVYAQKK
ncbi:methyltransferase domain-containing protein [bacterium]|nr:methyltransferase domain-containing protein [bacterium]